MVLDLILPGKDGLTLLKEMRQKGNQTPVMCVTARDALDALIVKSVPHVRKA